MTNITRHIALAGDSIFDNDGYVPNEPGVIEQLRKSIPQDWSTLKTAVDGDCIHHVYKQVEGFPEYITDLFLSIGGNDAIGYSSILKEITEDTDILHLLSKPSNDFRENYKKLLAHLQNFDANLHVCTIYTAVPFRDPLRKKYAPIALAAFNTIIKQEAKLIGANVIEIDKICINFEDFAQSSPIEPSSIGGQKIVDAIISNLMM